jgi:hypothetical protein
MTIRLYLDEDTSDTDLIEAPGSTFKVQRSKFSSRKPSDRPTVRPSEKPDRPPAEYLVYLILK